MSLSLSPAVTNAFEAIDSYTKEKFEEEAAQNPLSSSYEWGSPISEGCFAEVYEGRDQRSNSPVAIKYSLFPPDLKYLKDFLKEAFLYKLHAHIPHTLPLRNVCYQKTRPLLVSDLLEVDLRTKNFFNYSPRSIAVVLTQFLEYLAALSLPHADLKPENFHIDPRSLQVTIFDLGLPAYKHNSQSKVVQSTTYRSPEVFLEKTPYTKSIDIWSLGVIAIELYLKTRLDRKPPFLFSEFKDILSELGVPPASFFGKCPFIPSIFYKK